MRLRPRRVPRNSSICAKERSPRSESTHVGDARGVQIRRAHEPLRRAHLDRFNPIRDALAVAVAERAAEVLRRDAVVRRELRDARYVLASEAIMNVPGDLDFRDPIHATMIRVALPPILPHIKKCL